VIPKDAAVVTRRLEDQEHGDSAPLPRNLPGHIRRKGDRFRAKALIGQDRQSLSCERTAIVPAEATAKPAPSEGREKKDGMAFEPRISPLCEGNSNLNRLYQPEFQFSPKNYPLNVHVTTKTH
jgi:hypothetical protein